MPVPARPHWVPSNRRFLALLGACSGCQPTSDFFTVAGEQCITRGYLTQSGPFIRHPAALRGTGGGSFE